MNSLKISKNNVWNLNTIDYIDCQKKNIIIQKKTISTIFKLNKTQKEKT